MAGSSALVLLAGIVSALLISEAPPPDQAAARVVDPTPETALDSETAARGMAEHLALGNPEVLQHIAFQLEQKTGCRAQVRSHVVDTENRREVADERKARADLLAALLEEPTVRSASHGSARVADGPLVYHVVLAVVC